MSLSNSEKYQYFHKFINKKCYLRPAFASTYPSFTNSTFVSAFASFVTAIASNTTSTYTSFIISASISIFTHVVASASVSSTASVFACFFTSGDPDIELAQIERAHRIHPLGVAELATRRARLPSPWRAAGASMLSRAAGGAMVLVPLMFIRSYNSRILTLIAVVTIASALFVGLAMKLGRAAVRMIVVEAVIGVWAVMALVYIYTCRDPPSGFRATKKLKLGMT